MRQEFIAKFVCFLLQNATVITKYDDFITKCDIYYKLQLYNCQEHSLIFQSLNSGRTVHLLIYIFEDIRFINFLFSIT